MKFLFQVISLLPTFTLATNECLELCHNKLGGGQCGGKPYCNKLSGKCKHLFYTSEDKDSVCVIGRTEGCTTDFPILCSEAKAIVSGAEPEEVYCQPLGQGAPPAWRRPGCNCGKEH